MKLDKGQLEATKYINEHSVIIAGAGSGKTTTLIEKIKYIISNGINEDEILVISYTNESVNNFKSKCKYNVHAMTFHKAALTFTNGQYEIADESILEVIIERFLNNIPLGLKKKLFHIYNRKFVIYNEKKYINMINSNTSNSIQKNLFSIIKLSKTNKINIQKLSLNEFNKKEILLLYCSTKIKEMYEKELDDNQYFDFDDMIITATENINNNILKSKYKYILVDECQDISKIRLDFITALIKSNDAILTAVGDDFQSIYRFSGSNLKIFYNLSNYFDNCKTFFLENTYRCPQKIIDKSSKFILKNKLQIRKNIQSVNKKTNCIHKIYTKKEAETLYRILKKTDDKKSVLVLSRNNYDIKHYITKKLKYENDKFYIDNIAKENIRFMSFHKSKGLEADIVIIINLSNKKDGFPSKKDSEILKKILKIHEPVKYPEERRLFYVALTRTKSDVYLIIDQSNPSIFINEI